MDLLTINFAVFWLVLLVILVGIEIVSMGLTTIWFAGGALLATIAAALGAPLYIQIALFLVASSALLYFTRPIAVKYFNKDRARTNVESMIGKQAIVISEIDNVHGTGQVTVGGLEWSARSISDTVRIPVGAVVQVCAVQGVKLMVEIKKEQN